MTWVWTFLAVLLAGIGTYELVMEPRRRLQSMLDRVGRTAVQLPLRQRFLSWLKERVVQGIPLIPGAGTTEEFRMLVLRAGRPGGLSGEDFYFLQIILAVTLALAGWAWGPDIAFIAGILGLLTPRWWLRGRVAEITMSLRRELPQFVHLLATCLEAGLGLTEAIRRVSEESPGLLAKEMQRTILEIVAGKPAGRAWTDLMERTDCPELKEIVSAIAQSQEYGVAIAEQLRFTMRAIRQQKQQGAQQKAQEAAVRMRLPMVIFILLPTLMIVLGPSVVKIMRLFGGQV